MRGVSEVIPADRFQSQVSGMDPYKIKGDVDDSVLRVVSGYHLQHYEQMMVMEITHAFIEPTCEVNTSFSSIQEAVVVLLATLCDAISFPATFWTNMNMFSVIIYRAFQYLIPQEYQRLIDWGYTPDLRDVCTLTRTDLQDGNVPFFFTLHPGSLPTLIRRFRHALEPVGELYVLPIGRSRWSSLINDAPTFYIPFRYVKRVRIGEVPETPFSGSIRQGIDCIKNIIKAWVRVNSQSKQVATSIFIMQDNFIMMGRVFGSIGHFELFIKYSNLANGPEIP